MDRGGEATGKAVGYARSILRDGVREPTEFFVLPETQARGVGSEFARNAPVATDLVRVSIDSATPPFDELAEIDREVLFFRRDADHAWLAGQRPGSLYRRDGRAVGYGYHPSRPTWGGPYAALETTDLPVLLADGEAAAAVAGHADVTFDLPLTARTGLDHLLARGFHVDPFVMLFFTDGPTDGLYRYCLTSPPFFA